MFSDDSTIPNCKQVVYELLPGWKGRWHYENNAPSLGMAANWNHSIRMASGEYVLVLHDDDYLEDGWPEKFFKPSVRIQM
ncbi:MAG: glycosyltransferase family 2 protein [Limnothrix sp. RL_2_0]|nr:glycosyltransferase family 2 protein [Limnothrix sp. RL_2_0]